MARRRIKDGEAAPFLKWAGGKGQLLPEIVPRLPEQIETYYEPFVGGGAVFFTLANANRFKHAVLADRNPALVEAYTTIRNRVKDLIDALAVHADYGTDQDYYYEIRALEPKELSAVERVARLLYMNKTCFNGLFRVNRSGRFNVPFGRYKNPRILNEALLKGCSKALKRAEIINADFEETALKATDSRDAVYFDPPYVPISHTSSFTAYDALPFTNDDHRRLADVYRTLMQRGVTSVLSNSDCPVTRKLYRGLKVRTVSASRAINSVASKRGPVSELLVVGQRAAVQLGSMDDSAAASLENRQKKAV